MTEYFSGQDGQGYALKAIVEQVGQNKAENYSDVRVRLFLLNRWVIFSDYNVTASVTIEGRRVSFKGRPAVLNYNSETKLEGFETTARVYHDGDGSKTATISADLTGSGGYSPSYLSISERKFELTRIARASIVSVSGTAVVGREFVISINRAASSYTHKLRYVFGSEAKDIATGVGTSHTWTVPSSLLTQIPNSNSGRGTIYCETYSGGTVIGETSVAFTVEVAEGGARPTLADITLTEGNQKVAKVLTGANYLQTISDIAVSFEGAKGVDGSTITGYYAEIVDRNQSTNQNGGRLGPMEFKGLATIRAKVIDSRGRSSEYVEKTINVIEYFTPVLTFTVQRVGKDGSTLLVTRTAKIAPVMVDGVQKNEMRFYFATRDITNDGPIKRDVEPINVVPSNVNSLVNSSVSLFGNFPLTNSYEVIGQLSDMFKFPAEVVVTVPVEKVIFAYDKDSRFGIGKTPEHGMLDVAGDIYANGKIIQQHAITQGNGRAIYTYGKDFDKEKTTGVYFKNGKEPNNPAKQYGFLLVLNSNNECFQLFFPTIATAEPSKRIFYGGKWTPWSSNARLDHVNLINTGWQPAGYPKSFYKRCGDVLAIRFDFVGNGSSIEIAAIPSSVLRAVQEYMVTVPKWSAEANGTNVQINLNGNKLVALNTQSGARHSGQIVIML